MEFIKEIDQTLNEYGFKKVCEGSELEERIGKNIASYNNRKSQIVKRTFISDVLYVIASGDLNGKVVIEDFEKFAEQMKKKEGWSIEDKWLLKNLYVNYDFYEKSYLAEIKDTLKTVREMDLDSIEVESFIENKLSEEVGKEIQLKKIFDTEESRKLLRPYILERWAELQDEIDETGIIKIMQDKIEAIIKEIYNIKITKK